MAPPTPRLTRPPIAGTQTTTGHMARAIQNGPHKQPIMSSPNPMHSMHPSEMHAPSCRAQGASIAVILCKNSHAYE